MSNELLNRNKANVDADLLAAREEARRVLSDDALVQVSGGIYRKMITCSCGCTFTAADIFCPDCGKKGDGRVGMDEAMADITGLMGELDGWD